MKHCDIEIISQKKISKDYFELKFSLPIETELPRAGQFLTFAVSESSQPLLRRPFAFSSLQKEKNTASIIYQQRGEGTSLMTKWTREKKVSYLGPLGTVFPEMSKNRHPVLLAGGIGTGPMLFLSQTLSEKKIVHTLIFGCRTQGMVPELMIPELCDYHICTDDGSVGFKGNVIEKLIELNIKEPELFACGPLPMLKGAHILAQEQKCELYVSLEEMMGCAVGACMGCVVETSDDRKYVRVCKEGPVFNSKELRWK